MKARTGDRTAFDLLRQRLEAPVGRFLGRLIGQHMSKEDIVSDAFLALYMNLERIPSAESLRPFLFRVIRNLAYSELRRQGVSPLFLWIRAAKRGLPHYETCRTRVRRRTTKCSGFCSTAKF